MRYREFKYIMFRIEPESTEDAPIKTYHVKRRVIDMNRVTRFQEVDMWLNGSIHQATGVDYLAADGHVDYMPLIVNYDAFKLMFEEETEEEIVSIRKK